MTTMLAAQRITGVAPLGLVLDAAAPGSGVIQPLTSNQYQLLNHKWYLDGAPLGTLQSGKAKDQARGSIASYVIESAGAFTITLQAQQENGTQYSYEQVIEVTSPDTVYAGATYYVSTSGNNANDGSEATPFQTFAYAAGVLLASNGPRRILLKRGETFPVSTQISTTGKTGPYTIGAYGTGAKPILTVSYVGTTWFSMSSTVTDLRIMDLEIQGASSTTVGIQLGLNSLLYRCTVTGFKIGAQVIAMASTGVVIASNVFSGQQLNAIFTTNSLDPGSLDGVGIIDNQIRGTVGAESLAELYSSRMAIQGNLFEDSNLSMLRVLGLSSPYKTQLVCITDNIFSANDGTDWVLELGPPTSAGPKYVENVLVEANVFRSAASAATIERFIVVWADKVAIRNNVFDHTDTVRGDTIEVDRRGINNPIPVDVWVENNTAFRATSASGAWTFVIATNSTNPVMVRNNLVRGEKTAGTVASGNFTGVTNLTTDPDFSDTSNRDFHLTEESAALDVGTLSYSVLYDFDGEVRPSGAGLTWDVGAFEYQTTTILTVSGSPQIIIIPEVVNLQGALEIVQGSDYYLELQIKDVDGGIVDLSTVDAATQIWCEFRDKNLRTGGVTTGCPVPIVYKAPPISGVSPGKLWLHLPRNQTKTTPSQVLSGVWDLEMLYFGYKYRVFMGAWTIDRKQVTIRYSG